MKAALALSMSLALLACGCSADRDLPPAYRSRPVPADLVASPAAIAAGRALFDANCALCHGPAGDGRGRQSQFLDPKPRDLTDPSWQRATSPRRLFFEIREGRHGTAMPGWPSLSDESVWQLTAFVRSLSR